MLLETHDVLDVKKTPLFCVFNPSSRAKVQNLLTLNVTDCGDLKYLLSFSMAGSLMNLQSLFVSACEMMEDIFCPEHAEVCGVI